MITCCCRKGPIYSDQWKNKSVMSCTNFFPFYVRILAGNTCEVFLYSMCVYLGKIDPIIIATF